MNMIAQYMIVRAEKLSELVEQVNYQIKLGWQPFGAPFQAVRYDDGSGFIVGQAMISET
jgi:hypothetical protein